MATVSANSSTTISVPEGLIVTITTENNTTGTIARTYTNEGGTSQSVTDTVGPPAMNSVYGPYDRSCTMTIACTYGTITYVTSGNSVVTASIDPITGGIGVLLGENSLGLSGFIPQTHDLSGVLAALDAALNSSTCKNVLFEDAIYDLGSGYIPIVSGIGYIGERLRFRYANGGWTDAAPVPVGGARFLSSSPYVFWDGAEDIAAVTPTVVAQDATFLGGSADISVVNGALFTTGCRVYFTGDVAGFHEGVAYYIVYKSGNTLRLGLPDGVALTYSGFEPILATESITASGILSAGLPNDICTGVTMQNLIGVGVNTMIKAGAAKTFSFAYSSLCDIYATGVVANRGTRSAQRLIDIVNFAQCNFNRIFTYDGDGQYWGCNYPSSVFLPGNSKFSHLFDATNGNTVGGGPGGQCLVNRGIVFQAESESILNELHVDSVQNNRGITNVGRTAQTDASATINGTDTLTVTNGNLWRPGIPFTFNSIAGSSNIYINVVYYVTEQVGNSIKFSARKGDTNITPSGTGTVSISTWGFPSIEIGGVGTNPQIACSNFSGLDLEGHSSAPLHLQYVYNSDIAPVQCAGIVGRQVSGTTVRGPCGGTYAATTDFDQSSSILYLGARGVNSASPNWKTFTGAGLSRWNDSTAGHSQQVWSLSLHDGSYITGQWLTPKQRGIEGISYGPHAWMRANIPICPSQYALDTSQTFSNTVYVGLIIFNGAAGQTFTLPTIVETDTTATLVGYTFEVMNASANSLGISTSGAQTINNIGAKTTTSIAANSRAKITASKTSGGTLFWAIHIDAPAP